MDFPSLYPILLPKLPPMDLENALSTFKVFHTAVHLEKELTSEQTCGYGPVLMELTSFTIIFIILSSWFDRHRHYVLTTQLQCQLGSKTLHVWGQDFHKAEYLNQCIYYMVLFLPQSGSWLQESRGEYGSGTTLYYYQKPTTKPFASCSLDIMLCWSRGLSSRGRNVSTRRHNRDSMN